MANPPRPAPSAETLVHRWIENGECGAQVEIEEALRESLVRNILAGLEAFRSQLEAGRQREERLKARVDEVEASCLGHFIRDHLEGDGPEIDRWRRKVSALEAENAKLSDELKLVQDLADRAYAKVSALQRERDGLREALGPGKWMEWLREAAIQYAEAVAARGPRKLSAETQAHAIDRFRTYAKGLCAALSPESPAPEGKE